MSTNFGQVGSVFVGVEADLSSLQNQMSRLGPQLQTMGARLGAKFAGGFATADFGKLGQNLQNISQIGGSVGRALTVGVTAPLVAAGAAAVKFGGDFDDAMTQSLAIMGDVSDTMRKEMGEAAKAMSRQTTFSATEAAESFFFLASAGLDAKSSIEALPVVGKFAQAGMFDMARATDLLTDAQSALGLSIKNDAVANMQNMVKVSDTLVKANTISNATVEQFSESLTNKAGPALRALAATTGDFEERMVQGVAVLAAFADQGIKGSEAGTQLGIVLRDLQTKAIENREEFERFGVSVFEGGEFQSISDIIGDLEGALAGMGDEMQKTTLLQLGFNDKSVAAIQALLGQSAAIKQYEEDLRSAGGITDEVAKKQLASFTAQMKLLKNEVMLAGIELFDGLKPILVNDIIPALKSAVRFVADAAKRFSELPEPIRKLAVAGAAAAAGLGPVVFILSSLAGNIGTAMIALGALSGTSGLGGVGAAAGTAAAKFGSFGSMVPKATTAVTAFGLKLGLIPQIAIAVGVGIAAIKLGQFIRDTLGAGAALDTLLDKAREFANQSNETGETPGLGQTAFNIATGGIFINREEIKANTQTVDNLTRAITNLRAQGEDVSNLFQREGESIDEFAQRVRRAVQTSSSVIDAQAQRLRDNADAADEAAESADELGGSEAELAAAQAAAAAAAQAQADKIKQLNDNMDAALNPSMALAEELGNLDARFTDEDKIRIYGDTIKQVAAATRELEAEVDPTLAALEAQVLEMERAEREAQFLKDAVKELTDREAERAAALRQANEQQAVSNLLLREGGSIPPPPSPDEGIDRSIGVMDDFTEAVDDAREEILRTEERAAKLIEELGGIEEVRKDPQKLARVIAVLGGEVQSAKRKAEQFGFELGDLSKIINSQIEATERAAESAKKWERIWEDAIGNVVSDFSGAVADMIFEGGKFSTNLGNIFKELGKTIVRTLVTDAFTKVASGLSGAIFGGGGDGGGGGLLGGLTSSLGGILGGKLGGIFGGGGGGEFVGPTLEQAGLGGGGGFLGGALGANPVSGAIGAISGAIGLGSQIKGLIGQGRKAADQFVEGVQEPLDRNLEQLFSRLRSENEAGTLTAFEAEAALGRFDQLISTTQQQAFAFAQTSDSGKKVVRQFNEAFLPRIDDRRNEILDILEQFGGLGSSALTNPSAAAGGGISLETAETFDLAVTNFDNAVLRFAAQQVQSTIDEDFDRTQAPGSASVGDVIIQFQEPATADEISQFKNWVETNTDGITEKLIRVLRAFDGGVGGVVQEA